MTTVELKRNQMVRVKDGQHAGQEGKVITLPIGRAGRYCVILRADQRAITCPESYVEVIDETTVQA